MKPDPDANPDAPDIILPGFSPIIEKRARQFTSQGGRRTHIHQTGSESVAVCWNVQGCTSKFR